MKRWVIGDAEPAVGDTKAVTSRPKAVWYDESTNGWPSVALMRAMESE